jgi:beta-glucanase (GH16 family)
VGVSGNWSLRFQDEFNGSSLDTSRWAAAEGLDLNNVKTHASNVRVTNGNAYLTLASSTSGAAISSDPSDGAGKNGFTLPVGGYAEARVKFPGDGTNLYNWPAWWTSGPDWPAAGESDIAEVLGGKPTINYHSPSGHYGHGAPAGYWGDQFHTYGLFRLADHCEVYWDGKLVKSYATDDNGKGQGLLLNVGEDAHYHKYGAGGELVIDYVRAWVRP